MNAPSASPLIPRQARSRYQRGLLAWLQTAGDPAGLPEMRGALRLLETEGPAHFGPFWRTAEQFLRALSDGTLPADTESRRLCARIDLQIRAALAGATAPDTVLSEELDRHIHQGASRSAAVAELISLVGPSEAPDLDPEAVSAWKAAADAIIAAWDGRHGSNLAAFRPGTIQLCAAALALNLPDTLHLAEALASVGDRLDEPEAASQPQLRAAVAAALEILADTTDLGLPVFAQRVEHVARRLRDCCQPQHLPASPTLLRLFTAELREQTQYMRDELARLHPAPELLVEAALTLADHAGQLDQFPVLHLADALAQALERAAYGRGFDAPEVREALEATLAELETMADYLGAEQAPPQSPEILQLLAAL